jgi:hypothetical protein
LSRGYAHHLLERSLEMKNAHSGAIGKTLQRMSWFFGILDVLANVPYNSCDAVTLCKASRTTAPAGTQSILFGLDYCFVDSPPMKSWPAALKLQIT